MTQESEYSVAQLERMLTDRKTRLDGLHRKQERLRTELDKVEDEIAILEGRRASSRFPKQVVNRARNEKPLHTHVIELLTKHKKGLTLSDLSENVLESGYKTTSTNFNNVLYQCLYNSDHIAHDAATGCYKLSEKKVKA
ncbi:MAG: hypothetical protein O3A00_18425 [Planctomycetota bacterium]|nr:hypothetical protein [Planctomycetota bacterium]